MATDIKDINLAAALLVAQQANKNNYTPTRKCTCDIKQGADVEPFRSEEQVRDDILKYSQPVQIKDTLKDEIIKFDTYEQCVKYMGINWVTFERMLQGRTKLYHQWQLIRNFDK